jgi:hypothetical protein
MYNGKPPSRATRKGSLPIRARRSLHRMSDDDVVGRRSHESPPAGAESLGTMTLSEWLEMHLDVTRANVQDGTADGRKLITDDLAAVVTAVQICDDRLKRLEENAGITFTMG